MMAHYVLQDEVEDLKVLLDRHGYDYRDGADPDILETLAQQHHLPKGYQRFLSQLEPGDSAWRIGGRYHLVLHPADELAEWQEDPDRFQIGSLNGRPLALDLTHSETPVLRLMEDGSQITLASSLVQFFQILRTGLDLLADLAQYEDESLEEEDHDDHYSEFNGLDADAFAGGGEELISAFFEEIENIDPDCADHWVLSDGDEN